MEIKLLNDDFSVCKIRDLSGVNLTDSFYFIGKTDEELSLVCRTEHVPEETTDREDGWKTFRIEGVLDFSLIESWRIYRQSWRSIRSVFSLFPRITPITF